MRNLILTLLVSMTLTQVLSKPEGKDLTLEDIFKKHEFSAKYIWGMRHLKDGKHFSKIAHNPNSDFADILSFDLVTGDFADTIFVGASFLVNEATEAIRFDNYELSADETKILLSTDGESIYRHSSREYNYVWDRKTRTLQAISNKGKQRYAQFSPDGSKVAFVRDNNLFIKDLENNSEVQLTTDGKVNNIINGATDWVYEEEFGFTRAFFWSPDGKRIAYYRFDESEVKQFSMQMFEDLYPVDYTFKYPKAGEVNASLSIHCYELASGNTIDMDVKTKAEFYIPRIKWTLDPEVLAVLRMNRHQNKLEMLMVNARSGSSKIAHTEISETYIEINDALTFLSDKKHFLWLSEKDGFNHLYLYTMDGKLVQQITKGSWDVSSFYGINEEEGLLYFRAAVKSPMQTEVYQINLEGRGQEAVMKAKGRNGAQFTPTYEYFVGTHSNANSPNHMAVYTASGKQIRVLEDNKELKAKLKDYRMTDKEFFSFKTSEGVELNGWMIKPPDFNSRKKYPVMMYVYGGPGSQTVTDSWDGRGYVWYQYLSQQGYIIVSVDNRGTGNRGEDFKKITYLSLGKYETIDQIEAAKYLGGLRYVDEKRIGIWGWSYGGYMSALCITKGADVFKLAIAVAPVTHWKFYDTIYTERFMRTPEENKSGYEENSPINFAHLLEGKFLIIHATADDNVHFQNTVKMIEALVQANKQFDTGIYPNKNHSIHGSTTRLQLYTKMTNFILENL